MSDNQKTFGFFLLIALLCVVPYLHKKIKKGKDLVHIESENARELYTGKTRAVYNPLDNSYIVTDKLKELIAKEQELNFSGYKDWPVVSLWVDPTELYSENRGIFFNSDKHGRLWERASFISYYAQGSKKFSSFAGIRIHGGASRTQPNKSFRLYFRKKYGEKSFLKNIGISLKDGHPVKRLVLRRDTVLNFANDMSYTLIKKMGGLAPNIKHVAVFLNGEFYNYMQMVEQLHDEPAKYYFGHERFIFYKLKGNNKGTHRLLVENAIHRVKGESSPISFERMNKLFDLENITANMLMIIYTGMPDWAQGVWIKDQTIENAKWKLISWDFDYAFSDYVETRKHADGPAWEVDGFRVGLTKHDASLRSRLFNRLIKESPEYRKFFGQQVDKLFDEVLKEEFLTKQFTEYEKLAKDAPNNKHMLLSIQAMKDFIKYRKPSFCRQMQNAVGFKASTCSRL